MVDMEIGNGIREGELLKFPTHLGIKSCEARNVDSIFDSVICRGDFIYSVRVNASPEHARKSEYWATYHVYGITKETAEFLTATTGQKILSLQEDIDKRKQQRLVNNALHFNKRLGVVEVKWEITEIVHETQKAKLVRVKDNYDTNGKVWIPKSVIKEGKIKGWFHKIISNRVGTNGQFHGGDVK